MNKLAEPLPVLGDNTTSLPLTHPLEDYSYTPPLHLNNYITNTSMGITDYLIHIRGLFLYSPLQFPQLAPLLLQDQDQNRNKQTPSIFPKVVLSFQSEGGVQE